MKPYVDEGIAALDRGEYVTLEQPFGGTGRQAGLLEVKARVVVSDRARADIDAILDDLTFKAGVRAAGDYIASLKALYSRLSNFPETGAAKPSLVDTRGRAFGCPTSSSTATRLSTASSKS